MPDLTTLREWQELQEHKQKINSLHMRELFAEDPARFNKFSLQTENLLLDYSKNRVTSETLKLLLRLADARNLWQRIEDLFSGQIVNHSESRPALHTALRNLSDTHFMVGDNNIALPIQRNLEKMALFCEQIHNGTWRGFSGQPITDIVNIGIGGSDLGPAMVTEALTPFHKTGLGIHFVSNIDGTAISETLKNLKPATTLFIISSKSFSTLETLTNASAAEQWIEQASQDKKAFYRHFVAITANPAIAIAHGFTEEQIFPLWHWVGGRYSLWSAIGLPITLAVGIDHFKDLLAGAHGMDQHFRHAPFAKNMPVILALLGIWYHNFFDAPTHVILPYNQYLRRFPGYLQQADMESNGKCISQFGSAIPHSTGPIIWGSVGTNGQHAFHQLLHQGKHLAPVDFIISANSHNPVNDQHALLFASCLSQSKALMQGRTKKEAYQELLADDYSEIEAKRLAPHQATPGNRPSNTIVFTKLTPRILGALIALYEHKIFVQGALWGINSFDQWGVQLGKKLVQQILPDTQSLPTKLHHDSSTNHLIQAYHDLQTEQSAGNKSLVKQKNQANKKGTLL